MNDLFTVISIVISVSGATYASLLAVRDYLGGDLNQHIDDAESDLEEMVDSDNNSLKSDMNRKEKSLRGWMGVWNWAYRTPIILFALISYGQGIHVVALSWSSNPSATNWLALYHWVLTLMLIVDFVCIFLTWVAYKCVVGCCTDIRGQFTSEQERKNKEAVGE